MRLLDAFVELREAEYGEEHPLTANALRELGMSLSKLERFITRRRAIAALYDARFAGLAPTVRRAARTAGVEPAWHLYVLLIDFTALGTTRDAVFARLAHDDVGAQVHYMPVHLQPYYRQRAPDLDLPGAQAYYEAALSLPIHPSMSDADVETVASAVLELLDAKR